MLRRHRFVRSWHARALRDAARVPVLAALSLAVSGGCGSHAAPSGETIGTTTQAESKDTFGLGEGRSGAVSVTAAGTVVNTYAPISSVDATLTRITVGAIHGATTAFSPGDLLLVWRTTGLTAVSGSQGTFNLATDVGGYEFGRVKSVSGSVLTVTNPLGSTTRYATGSQVVRIPEYTTLNVAAGASVVPYAWDGSSGGAVVIFASTSVTNAGTVSADGAGFRGGALENASSVVAAPGCSAHDGSDETVPCGGAHKGEGLDPAAYALAAAMAGGDPTDTYGYGNYANGGGGGDARNAGGGGGGHAGEGGSGGNTASSDMGRAVGGLGGAPVTYDPSIDFVSMGGGGGAGDEDHMTGTAGGSGGGVVLVRAGTIGGAGSFSARGASVTAVAGTDGSGGGGAGGAIVLFSTAGVACSSASVSGGAGGSGGSEPDGPGGGGGGGVLYIESTTTTCTVSIAGGASGTTDASGMVGAAYGATAGQQGVTTPGGNGLAYGGGICTAAEIGANLCGGCVLDADCGASSVCDAAKNTCGPCNAKEQGSCTGTTSACSTTGMNDTCVACNGDFGSVSTAPCQSASLPTCVLTGLAAGTCGQCVTGADCKTAAAPACSTATSTCAACNGDNGTSVTAACPATASPYCQAGGTCGVCTGDADCAGNHAGPRCDTMTGACGNTCSSDAICGTGQWCDDIGDAGSGGSGVCQDRVANGSPVPGGTCTAALGARACITGVCSTTDNECGAPLGAACSPSDGGTMACRSGVCPSTGPNASTCEPCASDSDCTTSGTLACSPTTNQCVACTSTNEGACVGDAPLCNTTSDTCVACNGDLGTTNSQTCTSASAPFCLIGGGCGKCSDNSDCTGTVHSGLVCNVSTGSCGATCATNAECGAGFWCPASDGGIAICEAQLPNGASLPSSPSSVSKCTPAVAEEVCASGVCDVADNKCGPATDAGVKPVDAGRGPGSDGSVAGAAVSVEGGALSCDVGSTARSRGSRGSSTLASLFGVALALAAVSRRRGTGRTA